MTCIRYHWRANLRPFKMFLGISYGGYVVGQAKRRDMEPLPQDRKLLKIRAADVVARASPRLRNNPLAGAL